MVKSKFRERASKSLQSAIIAKEDNNKIVELQQKISLLTEEAASKEELLKELRLQLVVKFFAVILRFCYCLL